MGDWLWSRCACGSRFGIRGLCEGCRVTADEKPTIVAALSAVMDEVQAIGKDSTNTQQGFSFRGVDAVMNAVGPALRKHGVVIVPHTEVANYRDVEVGKNRTPQRECTIKVRYVAYGPTGDTLEGAVYAEALDSGDKATAKAHSVAYRTFLLQALTIPTHEADPDQHVVERAARPEPSPFISPENLERFKQACSEAGVDPADVVASTTNNRTDNPAELLKTETKAAKEELARLAAVAA